MARPPFTFDRNTLGSNESFPLRFMAGPPFAGSQLKNAGSRINAGLQYTAQFNVGVNLNMMFGECILQQGSEKRQSALSQGGSLSKGVLGLAVTCAIVACRRWQLWVRLGRADHLPGSLMCGRCSPVSGPTRGGRIGAALGQERTLAPQQFHAYSITSSASNCNELGTSRPSAFAVLRLMSSANFGRLLDGKIARIGTFQNSF